MMRRHKLRPLRTPSILQLEPAECGAACLGIVLAFHGRWVSLEELRLACGVTRDGSKASNVLKGARAFGLAAKGFGKTAEQLMELPRPSIIQWNFNQFVVFEGIVAGRAWINDPALGRRSVVMAEFSERYTGVVLALEPGPAFVKGGTAPRAMAPFRAMARRSAGTLVLIATLSVLLVLPGIILPGLAALFVDKVLADQLTTWRWPLSLAVVAAGAFQAVVLWQQQKTLLTLEARFAATLSARVLTGLLARPMAFIGQRGTADLAGRVVSADSVAAALSSQIVGTLFNLIPVLLYAVAMALYDPVVAMAALALPLLNIFILRRIGSRLRELNLGVAENLGRLNTATTNSILAIESIKILGNEDDAFARLAGYHARASQEERRIGTAKAIAAATPGFLQSLAVAMVLTIGGFRVIDGVLSIGALLALLMLLMAFSAPFLQLVELQERLQLVRGDLARVGSLLDQPRHAPPPVTTAAPDGSCRLELRKITFGYSRTDKPLIKDLSLVLEPGQRIAIVGGSGSGKSTLGRLIAGLLTPWSGEILHEGRPLQTIPAAERAALVAYVDQDVFLFSGTVRDNLTLWDTTVADTPLITALKDVGIYSEVARRPGGLDSVVTEAAANFSGGQRQRLDIARALTGTPTLLVLDEATSSLDTLSEAQIDEAIRRRGCSCIIIAHRLSTVRDADEILVLDRGSIIERGTHDELLALDGAYTALLGA